MKIEELEARLKDLEEKNRRLEDVEEIKKLQRIYGYYLERGNMDEVAKLFSNSPDLTVETGNNLSKKPIGYSEGKRPENPDDYLHLTIPVCGVVDVDPSGKTAKGRWYALMYLNNATPGGGDVLGVGMYENDYIKEDGKWKILHLRFDDIFLSPYEDGWAKTPKLWVKLAQMAEALGPFQLPSGVFRVPDKPGNSPFGDQMPFHYKHPITGK